MELSSFIRCLASFKNEFYYILPKSTNVEISISKPKFDSIREHILTGSTV